MDPLVGQVLNPTYAIGTAVLSYVISFFGSLLALLCTRKMVRSDGSVDFAMLAGGAVALGGIGIWSMHFIGMVAYRLPVPVAYNLPLTVVSLVAAIVISGLALYLAGGKRFNSKGWVMGSLLAGLGVCVMHYMGMYAMSLRAAMSLDWGIVAGSVAIAIIAAASALWLAFNLTELTHQVVAAAVMGVAVCSMHYVGMTAATMVCTAPTPPGSLSFGGSNLGLGVFGTAGAVLIFILWVVTGRALDEPKGVTPRHA
ncbi:MHYT domain-containing protein [Variovorax guangxiensis]|uniref:MHYT domain-containing protein n=1 Tax=Variovorax guangxiensis TaxID=1775474 RepID=UPI0028551453|nr:MHYT domain-containing protein [Variovorax guangxiensis]MDR6857623.1 NO-binding membrane sensor protein with MHYT domain [Variovorax guangxiensis]